MKYRLATNWKNVIYFDENGQVIYEWDGDIVRLERIKISRKKVKIQAKIESVFVKDTKKVEVLYNDEDYPMKLKVEGDIATIEGVIPVQVHQNDEIRFQVTCLRATQKSQITFLEEDVKHKTKEDGNVTVSKDWCVMLERKSLRFIPNEDGKDKQKRGLCGFILNH